MDLFNAIQYCPYLDKEGKPLYDEFEFIQHAYFGMSAADEDVLYRYEFDKETGEVNEVIPYM